MTRTKICTICGKKITQSQLNHAEAIQSTRSSEYTHTDCIDDLSRHSSDAYHQQDARESRLNDPT